VRYADPADWFVLQHGRCSDDVGALEPVPGDMSLFVTVTRVNTWSAARSRQFISKGTQTNQDLLRPITWVTASLHGYKFVSGTAAVKPVNGDPIALNFEMIAYDHHHIYDVFGACDITTDQAANVRKGEELTRLMESMRITGLADNVAMPGNK